MPGEDAKSQDIVCVAQAAALQEDLVRAQWNLTPISEDKVTVESVEELVWCFALDLGGHKPREGLLVRLVLDLLIDLFSCLLLLEIRFAVQVLGLNVADALRQRALEQNQIGWERLVFAHFDNASDLKLKTVHRVETLRSPICRQYFLHVLHVVLLSSLGVLVRVLDHRDTDDEAERKHGKESSVGRRDPRDNLQKHAEEKVGVGHL